LSLYTLSAIFASLFAVKLSPNWGGIDTERGKEPTSSGVKEKEVTPSSGLLRIEKLLAVRILAPFLRMTGTVIPEYP